MCEGSKLSPNERLGISENIRLHIDGLVARFFPPGHSSWVNNIGQFSIPMRTPRSWACLTKGFQTSRNVGQFASTDFKGSRPTNELTTFTPRSAEASISLCKWDVATSDS